MGRFIWTPENDTAIVAGQSDRSVAVSTIRMPEHTSILPSVNWYESQFRFNRYVNRNRKIADDGNIFALLFSFIVMQCRWRLLFRLRQSLCKMAFTFLVSISDLYKKIKKAQPPLSLHGQLLWREFFYCAATKNENFDKMEGNPICVQIPWDRNPEALAKWANVSTHTHTYILFV